MDPKRLSDRSLIRLASTVSLGGFVFGYDAVVISGAIEPVAQRFSLNAWHEGLLVAVPTLTAIAGTLLGGLAFSSLVLGPLYVSETAAARHRGQMVSMNQIAIVLGLSVAYFSNLAVTSFSHHSADGTLTLFGVQSWRWMFGIELIPATLWFLLLIPIPEAPRWLLSKGRSAEARTLLERLHGETHARAFFERLKPELQAEKAEKTTLLPMLRSRVFALTFLIAAIVAVAQQITGVNAIYFYAPTVFHQAGAGINASLLQASVIGALNLGFTFVAFFLVDRVGRRPLLLGGLIGIVLSMLIVGSGFSEARYLIELDALQRLPMHLHATLAPLTGEIFQSDVDFNAALRDLLSEDEYRQYHNLLLEIAVEINAPLILFGLCLFVASFASSLGPVMWIFLSEVFPGPVRGIAIAMVAALNSLTSFLVQLAFPVELEMIGAAATFWLYAGTAAVFALLVWRLVPETKGRHLEDIQSVFEPSRDHRN